MSSLGGMLVWDTEEGCCECSDSRQREQLPGCCHFCNRIRGQRDLMPPLAAMLPRFLHNTVAAWIKGFIGTCCNAQREIRVTCVSVGCSEAEVARAQAECQMAS